MFSHREQDLVPIGNIIAIVCCINSVKLLQQQHAFRSISNRLMMRIGTMEYIPIYMYICKMQIITHLSE